MNQKRSVAFTQKAANIFFHILTRCNLSCRHCYINPVQHGDNMLDGETIVQQLELFARRCHQPNVIFLGGEPTLHPELPELTRAAKKLGFASVTVDTNGFLFHRFAERAVPENVDYISFSLDGASRTQNDAIRGKGSYDACVAGIRQAIQRGFSISLIYTVSRANLHELNLIPNMLAEWGVHRFFIQVIGLRGRSGKHSAGNMQLSREEWLNTVPQAARQAAESGIAVSYPKVYLNPDEPFECAALCADNYFIFPNGRVYRCPLCEDFPIHALEIRNNQLIPRPKLNETDLFSLTIPEGCVMNKLIQPGNIAYRTDGSPAYRIACCLLKEEILP